MEGPPHGPLPSTRHSRARESSFVPHRISLDTRFRGYDVTQVTSSDVSAGIFEGVHWLVDVRHPQRGESWRARALERTRSVQARTNGIITLRVDRVVAYKAQAYCPRDRVAIGRSPFDKAQDERLNC